MLEIQRPVDQPYIVLESDIECPSKAIHIVNLNAKPVIGIGRRVNNEISISDISVSRRQAEIILEGNDVFVSDCESKFGTFVKADDLIQLKMTQSVLPIQIERKCFFFKLIQRFSSKEKCKFCFTRNYPQESFDHFVNVFEKFPMRI